MDVMDKFHNFSLSPFLLCSAPILLSLDKFHFEVIKECDSIPWYTDKYYKTF